MGLVDHEDDRPFAFFHDVAQVALPALGLLGDLDLRTIAGRQVVEQGFNERWQRSAPLVDRQRFGECDLAGFGEFGLDAAQKVGFPRTDQAGDHDKPTGLDGRTHLADDRALMLGLKVAGPLERPVEAVTGLNVSEHHSSFLRAWKRSRIRAAIIFLSSVSPSSSLMKARSPAFIAPIGRPSWSAMAPRAARPFG